jgi:GxxExxY protein
MALIVTTEAAPPNAQVLRHDRSGAIGKSATVGRRDEESRALLDDGQLQLRTIAFKSEVPLNLAYKQRALPMGYRVDFICFGQVLVEVKALARIGPIEDAQLMNYLKATRLPRGLLLNFGTTSLQYRRIVRGLGAAHDPLAKARHETSAD